jgi:hypothetical protein
MNGTDGIRLDVPRGRHHRVEGHHHFHMDGPAATAETIHGFIHEREAMRHGEST